MGGYPSTSHVYINLPHVKSQCKLRDPSGRTVRICEMSLHEALELFHRFASPKAKVMDLCTGTGVSIMAMLRLGLHGVVNDRDVDALQLGVARARCYLDHLYEDNKWDYPPMYTAFKTAHDGTDLYAWYAKALGYTTKQTQRAASTSRVLVLPPTNVPINFPLQITDENWKQVRRGGVHHCYIYLLTYC